MTLGNVVFGPMQRPAGLAAPKGWRALGSRLMARIEAVLDAERGRWFLWLPVLYGCGIALYLRLPAEPPLALAVAAVLLAVPLRMFFRFTALSLIVSSVCFMMALGFLGAKLRAMVVEAPMLQRTLNAQLTGWVERVERQEKRTRVTIRVIALENVKPEATPRRVRIGLRGKAAPPVAGQAIRVRAVLMPPPEPAVPGGFDFARQFWFSGIGGTGYAPGKLEVLPGAQSPPLDLRIAAAIAGFREAIGARVAAVLKGDAGAIASALIMGERGDISREATTALRNSGLYHVISISGLHMALTAGSAFWLVRALLALFPGLALRFPIKTWAAVAALLVASAYLVISGAAMTAVRSYIMIAIMFAAVILNRPALSLRNVAFSALVILAVSPESLTDAGFQMSFAATTALVAHFEGRARLRPPASWPRGIAIPVFPVLEAAMTTLVASLAVDPIAAYHFHRIATYSMLGNVLASPVEALMVMPAALMTLFVMPFGLEAWPLWLMEQGIDAMMAIAKFVSSLPGAVIGVPAFSSAAIALMTAGGLWLLIWRGRWRYWGITVIGAGLAIAPFTPQPDIWVDRQGKLMAVRDESGRMAVADARKGAFSLAKWMEADGDLREPKHARKSSRFQCDEQSCLVMVRGSLVSHVLHPGALADDCRRAAILIVSFPLAERCSGPRVVIDARNLLEKGAHTLRLGGEQIEVRTAGEGRGRRPWVNWRPRRETIPAVAPADSKTAGADADIDAAP